MILLDKQEIGSAILEDIFLDMLICMHRECTVKNCVKTSSAKDSRMKTKSGHTAAIGEIVKTANLLLGGMEPSFIWQFVGKTLESACKRQSLQTGSHQSDSDSSVHISVDEICQIIIFLLEKLSMVSVILVVFHC